MRLPARHSSPTDPFRSRPGPLTEPPSSYAPSAQAFSFSTSLSSLAGMHGIRVGTFPLLRANVLFSALPLAAGEHSIVVDFTPPSWHLGWWISLLAVSVTVALLLAGLAARRRSPIARHGSGPARPPIPGV